MRSASFRVDYRVHLVNERQEVSEKLLIIDSTLMENN